MISGDSSDDISKDCLVHYVKPYHAAASATGAGGSTDFSKWNLTLSSNYTEIKEGSNRITAKLSCPLISTRWYSVNPIGVQTSHTNANISLPTLAPSVLSPTNESAASILLPPEQQPSAPPTSSGITSESSGQKNKTMSVTIDVTTNPISRGSRKNISITVSDTASNEKIAGASITGKLLNPGGNYLSDFNGNTYFNGQFVYSWIIGKKGDRGELTIEAQAAASGYKPKSVTCISNI